MWEEIIYTVYLGNNLVRDHDESMNPSFVFLKTKTTSWVKTPWKKYLTPSPRQCSCQHPAPCRPSWYHRKWGPARKPICFWSLNDRKQMLEPPMLRMVITVCSKCLWNLIFSGFSGVYFQFSPMLWSFPRVYWSIVWHSITWNQQWKPSQLLQEIKKRATPTPIGKDTNSKSSEMTLLILFGSENDDPRPLIGRSQRARIELRETWGTQRLRALVGTGSSTASRPQVGRCWINQHWWFPTPNTAKWQVCRYEIHRAGAQIETFCHFVNKIQVLLLLDSRKGLFENCW